MRTVALRWIFTLRRVCQTKNWHKANLFDLSGLAVVSKLKRLS
jgi:hypothetical protein